MKNYFEIFIKENPSYPDYTGNQGWEKYKVAYKEWLENRLDKIENELINIKKLLEGK